MPSSYQKQPNGQQKKTQIKKIFQKKALTKKPKKKP